MRNHGNLCDLDYDLKKMCRHAIDRSCGDLVDVNIEYFGTDELLEYITYRCVILCLSPNLSLLTSLQSLSLFLLESHVGAYLITKPAKMLGLIHTLSQLMAYLCCNTS